MVVARVNASIFSRIMIFLLGLVALILLVNGDLLSKYGTKTECIFEDYEYLEPEYDRSGNLRSYKERIATGCCYRFTVDGKEYRSLGYSNDKTKILSTYKGSVLYWPKFPWLSIPYQEKDYGWGWRSFSGICVFFLLTYLAFFVENGTHNISGSTVSENNQLANSSFVNNQALPNPELDGVGVLGFGLYVFIHSFKGIFSVLFSIRGLFCIAMLVLAWFGLPIAKGKWPDAGWVDIASMITFANGGMYGDTLGAVGGVVGKAFVGAAFIGLLAGPKLSGKKFPEGSFYTGLGSFASWLFGIGAGLVLFNFTDYYMIKETSFIGLLMFFACMRIQKDPANIVLSFLNSFAKGRPFNHRAAKYCVRGAAWGFLIGFCLVWINNYYPQVFENFYKNQYALQYIGKYIGQYFCFHYLAYGIGIVFALIGGFLFII